MNTCCILCREYLAIPFWFFGGSKRCFYFLEFLHWLLSNVYLKKVCQLCRGFVIHILGPHLDLRSPPEGLPVRYIVYAWSLNPPSGAILNWSTACRLAVSANKSLWSHISVVLWTPKICLPKGIFNISLQKAQGSCNAGIQFTYKM